MRRLLPLFVLLAGCPTTDEPVDEPTPPPGLPDSVTLGEEIVCEDPVEGIVRMTEEREARGLGGVELTYAPAPPGSPSGSPVAADDIDGDGDVDLVFSRTRDAPYVLLNDGTGHFEEVSAGFDLPTGFVATNQALADYDGDGLPDLTIVGPGFIGVAWNEGGGSFTDLEALDDVPEWIVSTFALGDADGDGDLDLALPAIQEGFTPNSPGTPERVYLNEGDGAAWTMSHELLPYGVGGFSISATWTDRDNDGDQDLFVPYDRVNAPSAPPNAFYRNDGNDDDGVPILVNDAPETATNLYMSGMGIAGTDLNGDGRIDYCMSNTGSQLCLMSSGDLFVEVRDSHGLRPAALDDYPFWSGWSLELIDLDGDGWRDIPMAGGPPLGSQSGWEEGQGDALFHGQADGTWVEVTDEVGWDAPRTHFGLAVADYTGDGYPDVVISGNTGPPQFWNNPCGGGAWIEVELEGPPANTGGFGARLATTTGDRTQLDELWNLRSLGQSPSRFHVGLGDVEVVDRLELTWPDGTSVVATDVPVNRKITITY